MRSLLARCLVSSGKLSVSPLRDARVRPSLLANPKRFPAYTRIPMKLKLRTRWWVALHAGWSLGVVALITAIMTGCPTNANKGNADGKLKLKVAYIGLTCEPPIFVAQEKGFY